MQTHLNPLSFTKAILAGLVCSLTLGTGKAEAQGSLFGPGSNSDEPELVVELDRSRIYLGESVTYSVNLNNVEEAVKPTLEGFDKFNVDFLGHRPVHSRYSLSINGVRTEVVRDTHVYNYRLTPTESGKLTIPAPTAIVDGEKLVGSARSLTVIPPSDQQVAVLDMTVDHDSVYPMQPFTVSVRVAVRALPADMSAVDPTSVQSDPPRLNIPWFDSDQVDDAIEPKRGVRDILSPIATRGRGFEILQVQPRSAFSLFRSEPIRFRPPTRRIEREVDDGETADYWEYEFSRTFVANESGSYAFGPVTLKGEFGTEFRRGELMGESIYAIAEAVEVEVKQIPQDDRPESYIGGIGQYDVAASIDPVKAKVGDPLTLTLDIRGEGSLEAARPPDLSSIKSIASAFRIYEATEETVQGGRRFIYGVRPKRANIKEFPPVPIAYFDVEQEKYVTKRSDPIRLTIKEAEQLTQSDIFAAPDERAESAGSPPQTDGGLFGNITDSNALADQSVKPLRWFSIWGGMVLSYAFIAAVLALRKQSRKDPAVRRKRGALGRAKQQLAQAGQLLHESDRMRFLETLNAAVTGFVTDHADLPSSSLTPREAAAELQRLGVEPEDQDKARRLLEQCDAARYGASTDNLNELQRAAETLIDDLHEQLRTPTRNSKVATAACWITLFLLAVPGCARTADEQTRAQFGQAESVFAGAKSASDYIRAANEYQQILDSGFVSATVLYNQGNAWLRAGEEGRAIAAYRQAKRYRPRFRPIDENLSVARARAVEDGSVSEATIAASLPFFWRELSGYRERFYLTTFGLTATLIIALAYQIASSKNRLLKRVAIVFGCLTLLLMASVLVDSYEYEWTTHGVVTRDALVARRGASRNFQPALPEPLQEGTEFEVIGRRQDWVEVMLDNSPTVWLPSRAVVLF